MRNWAIQGPAWTLELLEGGLPFGKSVGALQRSPSVVLDDRQLQALTGSVRCSAEWELRVPPIRQAQ
jgi:hypothetical protein